MDEIGEIVVDLLKSARPLTDEKTGMPSRAKAKVPEESVMKARQRVKDLLQHFPLYPELDIGSD